MNLWYGWIWYLTSISMQNLDPLWLSWRFRHIWIKPGPVSCFSHQCLAPQSAQPAHPYRKSCKITGFDPSLGMMRQLHLELSHRHVFLFAEVLHNIIWSFWEVKNCQNDCLPKNWMVGALEKTHPDRSHWASRPIAARFGPSRPSVWSGTWNIQHFWTWSKGLQHHGVKRHPHLLKLWIRFSDLWLCTKGK